MSTYRLDFNPVGLETEACNTARTNPLRSLDINNGAKYICNNRD